MRSKFDETRDQRVANDASNDAGRMCRAQGCPNLWSSNPGFLCRWHAAASPEKWPRVTDELHSLVTDRIRLRDMPKFAPEPKTFAEKRQLLQRLRTVLTDPKKDRAWIAKLQARRAAGEQLSAAQRHALAQVEGAHAVLNAARGGANVPERDITEALEVTGDIPQHDDVFGRFENIPFPEEHDHA